MASFKHFAKLRVVTMIKIAGNFRLKKLHTMSFDNIDDIGRWNQFFGNVEKMYCFTFKESSTRNIVYWVLTDTEG